MRKEVPALAMTGRATARPNSVATPTPASCLREPVRARRVVQRTRTQTTNGAAYAAAGAPSTPSAAATASANGSRAPAEADAGRARAASAPDSASTPAAVTSLIEPWRAKAMRSAGCAAMNAASARQRRGSITGSSSA